MGYKKNDMLPGNRQGNTEIYIVVQQEPQPPDGQMYCAPGENTPPQQWGSVQASGVALSAGALNGLVNDAYQQGLQDARVKEYYKYIKWMNSGPRPKKGSSRVIAESNKGIMFSRFMSNGTSDNVLFIMNYSGPIDVVPIVTPGFQTKNAYKLVFLGGGTNRSIGFAVDAGKTSKGAYLYAQFRKAGVEFNPRLSEADIKEGLLYLLQTLIEREPMPLDVFAGWHTDGTGSMAFQSCENIPLGEMIGEKLPVSTKSFPRVVPTLQGIEEYFSGLRTMFPDLAARTLIAAWPVVGILSSLLRKHGMPIKAALNIIPTGDIDQKALAGLLQVFDRNRLAVFDAGKTKKQIDSILNESRDEVILFDCRYQSYQYQRVKRAQTADRLKSMMLEDQGTPCGRNADFAVAILSDQYLPRAFNVPLPEMDESFLSSTSRLRESQGLEMVLSGVVNLIESHYEDAEMIFCRRRDDFDFRLVPIDVAIAFLREFFRRAGHDLDKELELQEVSDLAARIEDDGDSDEERLALFVRVIRSHAEEWMCEEKGYGKVYHEGTFYYDEKYLYFPVEMLKDLFAEDHRAALLPRVLVALRSMGMLLTNGPNLTMKKVMIGNKRKEYYVFPIDLFNEKGKPDICDLARRGQDDE